MQLYYGRLIYLAHVTVAPTMSPTKQAVPGSAVGRADWGRRPPPTAVTGRALGVRAERGRPGAVRSAAVRGRPCDDVRVRVRVRRRLRLRLRVRVRLRLGVGLGPQWRLRRPHGSALAAALRHATLLGRE